MSTNDTRIEFFVFSKRFERDYRKLKIDIRIHVDDALKELQKFPRPASIRFEKLKGHKRPNIFSIHATSNHSHKITFEIENTTAKFRRIGTHKEIDDDP